jgi:hypothetical protein
MIYNVLLNSNNRVTGTSTANSRFYFDFGIMPEGRYALEWGFSCSGVDTTINKIGLLSVELGQSTVYSATSTNIRALSTNVIGVVIPNEQSNSSFLYGDHNLNSTIILNRPTNNEFAVTIKTLGGLDFVDSVSAPISEYLLFLSFEKI